MVDGNDPCTPVTPPQPPSPPPSMSDASLEKELRLLREENARLRSQLSHHQQQEQEQHQQQLNSSSRTAAVSPSAPTTQNPATQDIPQGSSFVSQLDSDQIQRYSRQLLLQGGFGVEGQLKLAKSSVLVVGAGGIGSTVILYLAACGVGEMSIVDFDCVDVSNLHRQVIHQNDDVGVNKAESACRAIRNLNPLVQCRAITSPLTYENAHDLVSRHTCVVDASDNPQTRYLVNDACVLANRPLVSGSAIGTEGQLTVYNHNGGPCYRCLYPKPSKAEGAKSCSDNGVLGTVPGTIGMLQATETIKLITGTGRTMHDRLLMYDSMECSFMSFKKPPRKSACAVCGDQPTIRSMTDSFEVSQVARGFSCEYVPIPLAEELQISCEEYAKVRDAQSPHVLLDVRVSEQFNLCTIPGAKNVPLANLDSDLLDSILEGEMQNMNSNHDDDDDDDHNDNDDGVTQSIPVFCLCRRGIFSATATQLLNDAKAKHPQMGPIKNIKGGLDAWRQRVDPDFPQY
eukprot:CAMPEP_0119550440 /NCGR_PEP_ID=MMETSP1352-20130426/3948_1 /TAXON_ID=265584 /ORGANISM="Stauroneis constricta, Strain CCMP1120" /LENGTH=512 /DNA_ID=CAMNT_0007596277 /DNA_START=25 /DNA_END=1563 /DNA_ORIENTATION=-